MRITFDKNTENERSLEIQRIYERPVDFVLSGNLDKTISSAEDFPDIEPFAKKPKFSTIEVTDEDGMPVPICDGYDTITDITATYYEKTKAYSLTLTVTKGEAEE